jgi:hypothetical protein
MRMAVEGHEADGKALRTITWFDIVFDTGWITKKGGLHITPFADVRGIRLRTKDPRS